MEKDTLDILKQSWRNLSNRMDSLEEANRRFAEEFEHSRTTSIQERLAQRTAAMGWCGLVLPVLAPAVYYVLEMPWWIAIVYGVFGVIMSVLSFMFAEYIRSERLAEMPVADALRRASRIKLRQTRLRVCGCAAGCVLVILMGFTVPAGPERETIIVGGAVGFAVGLVVGIRRCIVNARLARELVKSL